MLDSINRFIYTYQRADPLSHLLYSINMIRRLEVKGPHTWKVVKDSIKNIDVLVKLFNIPSDYRARHVCSIPLKYFKNVDASLSFYDRLIGAWGQFPHLDQAQFYFENNIYAQFMLHMRLYYTNIISKFYGLGLGCSYDCVRDCRELTHVAPPLRLLPRTYKRVVLSTKLKKSSQFGTETRNTIADNMKSTLAITHVTLHGEMSLSPLFPCEPLVPLHDDSYIESLGHDHLFSYARMCCDTIHDTQRVHNPCDIDQVHIYIYITFDSYQ